MSDISANFTAQTILDIYYAATNYSLNLKENAYTITQINKQGENYMGDIYKLEIVGKSAEKRSFIVKVMSKNKQMRKSLRSDIYFEREVFFYNEVLPKLVALQKSTRARENFQNLVPECYRAFRDFVVLRDLKADGFETIVQNDGFSKEQAFDAIGVLAKFHAMSFALRKIKPKEFEEICKKIPSNYMTEKLRGWYAVYLEKCLRILDDVVRVEEGAESEVLLRFRKFVNCDFYGRLVGFISGSSDYLVIASGDAWSNNFLFSTRGAVLLDFQMARCSSPIIDLLYAIHSSVSSDVLYEHFDDLTEFYYKTMGLYLKDMGVSISEVFPENHFKNEVVKYMWYGVASSLSTVLLAMQNQADFNDLEIAKYGDDDVIPLEDLLRVTFLKEKSSRQRLVNILKHGIQRNVL